MDINIYPFTIECNAPLSMFIWKGRNNQMTISLSLLLLFSQMEIGISIIVTFSAILGLIAIGEVEDTGLTSENHCLTVSDLQLSGRDSYTGSGERL